MLDNTFGYAKEKKSKNINGVADSIFFSIIIYIWVF